MKSYTDLEQSKALSKILPLESADMFCADVFNKEKETHSYNFHILSTWGHKNFDELKERENKFVQFIPCWSLAALFSVIPQEIFDGDYIINITEGLDNRWALTYDYYDNRTDYYDNRNHSYYGLCSGADNLVDACYEMILRLHERKVL